jgi:hypothetical protein
MAPDPTLPLPPAPAPKPFVVQGLTFDAQGLCTKCRRPYPEHPRAHEPPPPPPTPNEAALARLAAGPAVVHGHAVHAVPAHGNPDPKLPPHAQILTPVRLECPAPAASSPKP